MNYMNLFYLSLVVSKKETWEQCNKMGVYMHACTHVYVYVRAIFGHWYHGEVRKHREKAKRETDICAEFTTCQLFWTPLHRRLCVLAHGSTKLDCQSARGAQRRSR